jgi:beta-galactosidase
VYESHATLDYGLPGPKEVAGAIHRHYYERGYAVGFVHPADDLSGLKLYFVPHWVTFSKEWVDPLTRFVANGGVLVVGARTATRDMNNNVTDRTPPGLLRDLTGIRVEEYGRRNNPGARPLGISFGRNTVTTQHWYEQLAIDDNAAVLYSWHDRHLAGSPAVSLKRRGKGAVIYVGTYFTPEIIAALAPQLNELSGVKPLLPDIPRGVDVTKREGDGRTLWFLINHNEAPVTLDTVPPGKDLITGEYARPGMELEGSGVVVLRGGGSGGVVE